MSKEKKVKIISLAKHRVNQTITLPEGLGDVTFDGNCEAEVDEAVATSISKMDIGIEVVSIKKSSEENDEDDYTEESLSKMSVKELKEVCKNASLPEEEYKKLNKTDLVTYILEKIGGSSEENDEDEEEEE